MKEFRVYTIDIFTVDVEGMLLSDEQFMSIAEEQGNVYSIEGFVNAFNCGEVSSIGHQIRFITV